jgi:hypothetical protein
VNDDQLRRLVHAAHDADRPPGLRALLARRPPRRRRWWLLAPAAIAVAGALLLWPRRAPEVASLDLGWSAPLDFLLDVPGAELLREAPSFELKGSWP